METQGNGVRLVLEQAIRRAEIRAFEIATRQWRPEPSSKADKAIRKLREDRQLSFEELHRPITI